jgi:benzoate-CoA ligase
MSKTVLAQVGRRSPHAFFSVPTFYRQLLALGAERLAPFRNVRRFVAAGERVPALLIEQWRAATGGEILSLYGMSETFCACLVTPQGSSNGMRTGKPLAGVEAQLRNAEGREAGPGEAAELWLRHPALALGYANRPEQTAAQFRDGWFGTRDLFVRDSEGFFLHQGRSDELVKIAGQWVQPGELEEAVAGDPAIAEAACVQVTDSEGFERLALFVTAPRRGGWRGRRRGPSLRAEAAALQATPMDPQVSPNCRAPRPERCSASSCASCSKGTVGERRLNYCAAIRLARKSGSLRRRSDGPS